VTTKERIAEAGLKLFHERGFNGTSVQDIVAAAGVPKGSFYNHFSSKEALAVEAVRRYAATLRISMLTAAEAAEASPLARIEAHLRYRVALIERDGFQHGCLLANLAAEVPAHSAALAQAVSDRLQNWASTLARTIQEAQEAGELASTATADALADYVVNGFGGATTRARLSRGRAPLDEFLAITFDALLAPGTTPGDPRIASEVGKHSAGV
jgi:TetR/AcrR family transcriptional repressor of nem operon